MIRLFPVALVALSGCGFSTPGPASAPGDGLGLQEYEPVDTGDLGVDEDAVDDAAGDTFDATCPQPDATVSLGEGWSRGWVQTWFDGTMNLHNSGPQPVSMDAWHVWFAGGSQDAAAGSGDYAYGTDQAGQQGLEIAPGQVWALDYTSEDGPAWWCVERTQLTATTNDFHFNGAEVPEPLMQHIFGASDLDDDGVEDHGDFDTETGSSQAQHNVWDEISAGPVLTIGRVPNYIELKPGETRALTIEVVNLGRAAGNTTVHETIPAGTVAGDFSREPTWVTDNADGTTTYSWATKMAESVDDPDLHAPTLYAITEITYQLTWTAPQCGDRVEGDAPRVDWEDVDGAAQVSWGTPLMVACCPG